MEHLQFLLLGLGNGAVFAALALALVVTYRSSGVINFATGAIALYVAYTYAFLREGELFVPIPGLPDTIDFGGTLVFVPAVLIALAIAALLGLILYVVVFRPLRTAPPVAKAVASLGIMVLFQATLARRLGTTPVSVDDIFPTDSFMIGDATIPGDRIWFAGTVLIIGLALAAAFRFTRFGLATRAAAETEKGAVVSGISPDRVAAVNWMISAMVAGLSGILIAPIVPLVPVSYTLFIVPALAAALVGGFSWLGPAVIAGLAIGMLQSEATFLETQWDWLPSSGTAELIPLILILGVLVISGKPLPSRGALIQRTLGRAPRPQGILLPAAIGVGIGALGLVLLDGTWRGALITSMILAIVGLSLVVVTGYAGQVSLAQLTLAGAAGFLLSTLTDDWGIPFPIAPLLAALVAAAIGVVIGLPALRVRGLPVAVVTLGLAVSLEALWFRNNDYNGGSGGARVEPPELFGLDLNIGAGANFPRLAFGFMCLAALTLTAIAVAKLRTSRLGSAMLAVRANERSAAAAGISVVGTKLAAFAIAAFIAGIGGSLLGYRQGNVTFASYTALLGLGLFATAYLAGITSVSGGLLAGILGVGGLVFFAFDRWIELGLWYEAVSGVLLVLTVILNPEGIVGPAHVLAERLRARRRPEVAAREVGLAASAAEAGELAAPAAAAHAGTPDLLAIGGVTVRYGGVVAVDDVSLDVPEGKITGVIGPNGAGKTTLLDALSGFAPARGSVRLEDRRVDGSKPHQRVRSGLGRTFQAIELYDDLSVAENIGVGISAGRSRGAGDEQLDQVCGLLGLDAVRDRPAGDLSQGQRQLVSIARALVGRPRVLLLDEPAAGLDTAESTWLGERLRLVCDSGVTIVLVDHDMSLVLGLCDEIVVLDFGRVIAQGPPSAIRSDRKVTEAYLGSTHDHAEVGA